MKRPLLILLVLAIFFPLDLIVQERIKDKPITLYLEMKYDSSKTKGVSRVLHDDLIKICNLIETVNESKDPFEIFKEKVKEISLLLKKAAGLIQDVQYKKYFNSLSEDILNDNYLQSNSDWLNINNRVIDLLIKKPQKQKKVSFSLLTLDPEASNRFKKYFVLIDKMIANSTMKIATSPLQISIENPYLFYDVLRSSMTNSAVFVHPDIRPEGREDEGFKVIFCINIIEYYFEKILKPISELVLVDRQKRLVKVEAYLSNMVMHRISHSLGPFSVESKSEELTSPQEKLKDLFYCIEEIKADAVALSNIEVLVKEKLISENDAKSMYVLFVLNLLDKLRAEISSEGKKPFLVILNYLLKRDGIIYDINKQKILINISKLKKDLKSLMFEVVQIERDGIYSKAKKLIDGNSSLLKVVEVILQIIEKIPKKVHIAVK